jgi:hypothetical protein
MIRLPGELFPDAPELVKRGRLARAKLVDPADLGAGRSPISQEELEQ